MFRMYASNSHSDTRSILAVDIARKPTVWGLLLHNPLAYMTWPAYYAQAVVAGCGSCGKPCVNRNANCTMWAKKNQCAENPGYMYASG